MPKLQIALMHLGGGQLIHIESRESGVTITVDLYDGVRRSGSTQEILSDVQNSLNDLLKTRCDISLID